VNEESNYQISKGALEVLRENKLLLSHDAFNGAWKNQKAHARCNIELITHHFPSMSKEEQKRAGRTINKLKQQYGIAL